VSAVGEVGEMARGALLVSYSYVDLFVCLSIQLCVLDRSNDPTTSDCIFFGTVFTHHV
jgi:hypothetical protein